MIGHSSDLKSPRGSGQTAGADMISNDPRVCCVCNWKTVIRSWEVQLQNSDFSFTQKSGSLRVFFSYS